MTTHFSILAWRIPSTEEPGRPQSIELQTAANRTEGLSTHITYKIQISIENTHNLTNGESLVEPLYKTQK